MDRAVELEYIGGMYGSYQPTEFICLVLKMLQLLPEKEIIIDLIKQEDFKQVMCITHYDSSTNFLYSRYLRALAAFYLRLTGRSKEIYQYLEPLLNDYRKLRVRTGGMYIQNT